MKIHILVFLVGCVCAGVLKVENVALEEIQESSVEGLSKCNSSEKYKNWSHIDFNPREVEESDTACLALSMFKEMGFVESFTIPELTLSRFILYAQKTYRNNSYHNWVHGFGVLHFCYTVLKQARLIERNFLLELEGLALMTAAMCHDADHPGTDNNYQKEADTQIYQKYKEQGSYLERHHIEETMKLLSAPKTNFISHLNNSEVNSFKDLVTQIILATDLGIHNKQQMPKIRDMIKKGFKKEEESDRELMCSQLISCGDLADQTRDWPTVRRVSKLVLTEFYNQGDLMKEQKLALPAMYDRDQANIPESQINFIRSFAEPAFEVLYSLLPETERCIENVRKNKCLWEKSIPYFENLKPFKKPLDIVTDPQLDSIAGC